MTRSVEIPTWPMLWPSACIQYGVMMPRLSDWPASEGVELGKPR